MPARASRRAPQHADHNGATIRQKRPIKTNSQKAGKNDRARRAVCSATPPTLAVLLPRTTAPHSAIEKAGQPRWTTDPTHAGELPCSAAADRGAHLRPQARH